MTDLKFTPEEKDILIPKIKNYLFEELDKEVGRFEAEFLLEFFTREVGVYFYNRGLYDAQAILERKMDAIKEGIYELEKPTEFTR